MAKEEPQASGARPAAWALTLAGTMPFLVLALALVATGPASGWHNLLVDGFRTGSALALAFCAGIRWGLALRREPGLGSQLAVSSVAAAVGWAALFLPDAASVGALLVAHCAQGAWDSIALNRGEGPQWFALPRVLAALFVAFAHIIVLATLL